MTEPDINVGRVVVLDRYPDEGLVAINDSCKELAFVEMGQGTLVVNGQPHWLQPYDAVLLLPGERYYWRGHFHLVITSTPAWSPQQHRHEALRPDENPLSTLAYGEHSG